MRMRLVYLTCTLLWLVMSVLIGLSFVGRSVFRAEQRFDAFEQHLAEQIGQTLKANEVVLYSYAAYRASPRSDAEDRQFSVRILAHNPQIKRLFYFDDVNLPPHRQQLLQQNTDPQTSLDADRLALLSNMQQAAVRVAGTAVMRAVTMPNGQPAYYLVRAIEGAPAHYVAMQVDVAALLPRLQGLPSGGTLTLWQGPQGNDWLLQRASSARRPLETRLFPSLHASHPLGGLTQPLTLQLTWQLGYSELDPFDILFAAGVAVSMLVVMLLGLQRYARFLEGSQEREMRLFYLANHDRLTNLANRNLFYDRLQHAISRLNRKGRSLAVLFLDMDRFKPVNDTYGHATGDRVLQVIAARLKAELRTEDTVARLGGDEFAVLIEEVESKQEVTLVVERLKRAIERAYELDGHAIQLGVSIGVAYYPEDGLLIEELLSVADRKMYGEKNEPALVG